VASTSNLVWVVLTVREEKHGCATLCSAFSVPLMRSEVPLLWITSDEIMECNEYCNRVL
jgi:hypothetical protein